MYQNKVQKTYIPNSTKLTTKIPILIIEINKTCPLHYESFIHNIKNMYEYMYMFVKDNHYRTPYSII